MTADKCSFPEGCDGYMCPECEPYGCSFPVGSTDLDGNLIEPLTEPLLIEES